MTIDYEIERRKTEIAKHRRAIEALEGELRGLELAKRLSAPAEAPASLAPEAKVSVATPRLLGSGSAGRQVGAISKEWRSILKQLDHAGGEFSAEQVVECSTQHGINIRVRDARARMRHYAGNGLVVIRDKGAGEEVYSVSAEARKKFGFVAV